MADSTVPLAALALVGTILTLVVTPLFKLLRENTQALSQLVESNKNIASATTKGAAEAKQRNGHLGDQNLKLAALVTAQNKDVEEVKQNTAKTAEILSKSALIAAEDRDALVNINQTVKEQTVEHQIIKELK